jgi:hypothetical protein
VKEELEEWMLKISRKREEDAETKETKSGGLWVVGCGKLVAIILAVFDFPFTGTP